MKEKALPSEKIVVPDKLPELEGDGPVTSQDVSRGEEKLCLEDDDVGEQRATEPPVAAQNTSDVQFERANEHDEADGLESVSVGDPNHVKEAVGFKVSPPNKDQTDSSSNQSGKHHEVSIFGCSKCSSISRSST